MTRKALILLAVLAALVAMAGCRSAHVTSAILYLDQNQFDKAINVLHEGLDYSPDEPDAYFYLGEAHTKVAEDAIRDNDYAEARENYRQAYEYYSRARELAPELLTDQVAEALQYSYSRNVNDASNECRGKYYEAAEGYFRLAYTALPDSVAPIKNIARMKIKMANETVDEAESMVLYNESLDLLDEVLANDASAYDVLADKANVLGKVGRAAEANDIYENLLREHPEDAGLLIDIASLAEEKNRFERAADLFVRVIDIYEQDDDTDNDEEIYPLALRSANYYADSSVQRYADALTYYQRALQLEENPEENTMMQKLQVHYKYGKEIKGQAEVEPDPVRKAEMLDQAKTQFEAGVNVGNALVNLYLDSKNGYFYLALCQGEVGDTAAFDSNMAKFQQLDGE